ncbi:MAG: hypothetical protein M1813_002859 [Trichoglossum hirsutum]|nr:MAG: hypothetical protein M1813_002859 [Trichoglossum hirsutum]
MRFSIATFFVAALATIASAQSPNGANPFNIPPSGLSFTAGSPSAITWTPTSQGTITIILRQGSSTALGDGTPIAKNIANSGSFSWTPPSDIVRGSDYALQIVDDTNPNNINFTPQFVIESTNTVSSVTSSATKSATTTAASSSSASSATTSAASSSSSDTSSSSSSSDSSSSSTKESSTLATKTSAAATSPTAAATSAPSSGAAAPAMKVSGGMIVLALGMLAL